MVNKLVLLFLIAPLLAFSGEFIATVNRNQVPIGESLTLNLTLKESSAKDSPNLGALAKSFYIQSQQQSNHTSIINGKISSSASWKLSISPQKSGELVIPSISLQTSDGILSTQPITILVSQESSNPSKGITLSTEISHTNPYKNEPFIYTIKLISPQQMTNVQMPVFEVANTITEPYGDPTSTSQITNGVPIHKIEFRFLVTPLQSGKLTIPPTHIQGFIPEARRSQKRSFFDDEFDPFSLMQGIERVKPFHITTEESLVEVLPPISGIQPWLPAKSLIIEEVREDQKNFRVGEPFSRTLLVTAEGLKSSQLPNLHDLQIDGFKIYADKPELQDDPNRLLGRRKEVYTIIPQKDGLLTLPEITLAWWDVAHKEQRIAKIPARQINVMPAPQTQAIQEHTPEAKIVTEASNGVLYAVIGGLVLLLISAAAWMVVLQRKVSRLSNPKNYNPFTDERKRGKFNDLNPT